MKRWFSLVLMICMLFTVVPFPALAEEAQTVANGACGEGISWTLDSDGVMCLRGEGSVEDYAAPDAEEGVQPPWSEHRADIRELRILEGVAALGENAFASCPELELVYFPVSLEKIGDGAFSDCEKLSEIRYGGTERQWSAFLAQAGNQAQALSALQVGYEESAEYELLEDGETAEEPSFSEANEARSESAPADDQSPEGYVLLKNENGTPKLYAYTDDGALIGEYTPGADYTGIYVCRNATTYLKNGVPFAAGLVKDGDDYYYFNSSCAAVIGNYDVTRSNGLLLPGFYRFGSDGKMINPPVYADGPNNNGFFYLNGAKQTCYQLIHFDGNYYFISDYDKYARNITLSLSDRFVAGTDLTPGNYYFDDDGVMSVKDGPDADGFFYLDGRKITGYQLIRYQSDYYFISDGNRYARNVSLYLSAKYLEGTQLKPGSYSFDSEGKLILADGPGSDGYFYLNSERQRCYQLIKFEGSYYFINDCNKYAKDCTIYLGTRFVNGTDLKVGYYYFGADGKMDVKNGPNEDGYFYREGVRQNCYQLIEFEGSYYFINDGHKYAKNCTIYLSTRFVNGTDLKVGYYYFAADGKMDVKNGPNEDGYFYRDGVRQNCYQLVTYEGNYYFINDGHKYAKNCTIYLSARFVQGTDLKVGYYSFGADGKMDVKNGPNEDGYFYREGVRQNCYQLVEFEGSYYFINDGHKYAKNCTIYLSARFVQGTDLKVGYYSFGADGKMDVKNGPNEDGYFYRDGVKLNAYQLVEFEGGYFFINDGNKFAKNCTIYLSKTFVEGTDFAPGYYDFGADGKLIVKNGPDAEGFFYLNGVKLQGYQMIKYEGDYYFIYSGSKILKNRFMDIPGEYLEGTDLRHWYYEFDDEGRMVGYYEGIPNGRDIGEIKALRTMDGKDIKSGLLIRGCELDCANYYYPEEILEIGIERLKNEFHVKFDMDLRSPSSVGKDLLGDGVIHKNYAMVMYDQVFTNAGKAKVKEVFTDLANPDNYPMYLHCTHGIDRTGTVCFILEMALGVQYDNLWKEYMYSVGAHDGSILKVWNGIMDNYAGNDSREKAIAFLKDCGITQEQIDSLYQIFLTD